MFLQNNSPLHMRQSRDVLLLTQNSDQTLHRYQIHIIKELNNTFKLPGWKCESNLLFFVNETSTEKTEIELTMNHLFSKYKI